MTQEGLIDFKKLKMRVENLVSSVSDPHSLYAYPDPGF
jgi:hypothetical protein